MATPAGRHRTSLRHVGVALFALVAVLSSACSGGSGKNSASPRTTPSAAVAVSTLPVGDKAPPPTEAANPRVSDEPVAFQTDDGVTIHGHLYTTSGPRQRAVIFAHMFPNDQRVWQPFARELAATGVAALTFDFRGYGESPGARNVAKIDHDLTYALLFMKSRDYPLVYLVGASMGGTAVLKVAAAQDTAGIITISAPASFMGLDAQPDLPKIKSRKFFLASRNEAEGGGQAAQQIFQAVSEPKSIFIFEGSAHGTDLLQGPNAAALKEKIIDFIEH
jgi:esterase/lipase